jgi:hypothetical protein
MANKKGMAMVGLLIVLVIIGLMWYFMTRSTKKAEPNSTQQFVTDAGVDTSSYKRVIDSTKEVLKKAEESRPEIP